MIRKTLPLWTANKDVLWKLIFPGIGRFVEEQARRGHHLEFVNFSQLDSYHLKPLFVKIDTYTARGSGRGFSSKNWRITRTDDDELVNLGALAGNIKEEKRDLGPSSIEGFKGMLNLSHVLDTGELYTGGEAAKDLFDNRLIVSIDPGSKNFAGQTFSFGQFDRYGVFNGRFMRKNWSTECNSRLLTISLLFLGRFERGQRRIECPEFKGMNHD